MHLNPGEYREEIHTIRDGEPEAPITLSGPPEAVIRGLPEAYSCLSVKHNHVHVRGITINGLAQPDRRFEDASAYATVCVGISPVSRKEEGVEYLYGVVVEPSRIGNSGGPIVQTQRIRDATIGNFEVIGPAGMAHDRRMNEYRPGHVREIVYIGSPAPHRGEPFYRYETLDRSRNVRVHHIDNSAGYRHNELVDVKLGSTDITIEYCTTRNAGHTSEGGVDATIDLKGNDCTVRWNDLGASPIPFSFGSWAPSDDVDGSDWSRNNAIYGNVIRGFAAGVFRLRNKLDQNIGPASLDAQRVICGNEIDRGSPPIDPWLGGLEPSARSVVDRRERERVTVGVAPGSNGFEFDPAVVLVDRGSTVAWEWDENAGSHYVVRSGRLTHDPESHPDPVEGPNVQDASFDEIGVFRFGCVNHPDGGVRGVVIVASSEDRYAFSRDPCEDVPDGDGVGHTGGDSPW